MKNKTPGFDGTGVALVTPFTKKGKVDAPAFRALIRHIQKGKCDYAVILGTTAESVTLSADEKLHIRELALDEAKSGFKMVLGVGGNNTAEIVQQLQSGIATGFDGILSVSPYYNRPSQAGIIEHYRQVCASTPLPVILYNVPARTGSNLTAATTLEIAQSCKNAVAIKEASGNVDQAMQIIAHAPKGFSVISGDDNLTLPLMAAGAKGVISVIAQAFPLSTSEMVRHALKGDFEKARKYHYSFYDFIPLLFAEGNPAGIKTALKALSLCEDPLRLPLVSASPNLQQEIKAWIKKNPLR